LTGYALHMRQRAEENRESSNVGGHYRDLQRELLLARKQSWYGLAQVSDVIARLESLSFSYVQQRQVGIEILSKLAPYNRPLYDWAVRYPGDDEYFVSTSFGSWTKNLMQLLTALSYREIEGKNQQSSRGQTNEREGLTDASDGQKSMLLFYNTLREMREAIVQSDGVYDRPGFEDHFDLHWVFDSGDGGDHGDEDVDPGDVAARLGEGTTSAPTYARVAATRGPRRSGRKRGRNSGDDVAMSDNTSQI